MPAWQRTYLAVCGLVTGYALAYAIVDYLHLPRLFYDPRRHEWHWRGTPASTMDMGYFGLWVWGLLAGVAVAAALWLGLRGRVRPLSERTLGLASAWTFTAVGLAVAYFGWHNWP